MSHIPPGAVVATGAKTLWAAVGVLGVAVVGLGGALYYTQVQQSPEATASLPAVPVVAAPAAASEPVARQPVAEKATPAVAAPAPRPAAAKTARPAPVATPVEAKPAPAKPVCADCATVTAVTPVEREGQGSGTGAVAGGVLGAIVGNQVCQGQGKDLATIIGAIGGGIAGNQVEKKIKKVTVYQVELRLDDGSLRTLEQAEPAAVGARVRVSGDVLLPLASGN
ncbi:MAG: glycine zipper 2TM domain-containing protein [Hylemonella sp.]|nr:glycine zipper 2TM domain-containing protein [Hylemonella sp.]